MWVFGNDFLPIVQNAKTDNRIAQIFHALGLGYVPFLPFLEQVMRSININGNAIFLIQEIWTGMTGLNELLSMGWQVVMMLFKVIQSGAFEIRLAQIAQPLKMIGS